MLLFRPCAHGPAMDGGALVLRKGKMTIKKMKSKMNTKTRFFSQFMFNMVHCGVA